MSDLPETRLVLEGRAELDYFDDGGTAMGVEVVDRGAHLWVTVRHAISEDAWDPDHTYQHGDHPNHVLLGRRCRVTVEILEDDPSDD